MNETEEKGEKANLATIAAATALLSRQFSLLHGRICNFLGANRMVDLKKDRIARKQLENILRPFSGRMERIIRQACVSNWDNANSKNDMLAKNYLKSIKAEIRPKYFLKNTSALSSFLTRVEGGIGLSDRVWNITDGFYKQLEAYVGSGILEGRSAADLAIDIRMLLKRPDQLYRRIKNLTGQYKLFADEIFHPGQGVYRSSFENAMRLTATEINMAYRTADHVRRKQLDFVMGFQVHLSKSHPEPDICDHLQGSYPINFKFVGWHPRCFCFTTSILMSGAEYKRQEATGQPPKRLVKSIPDKASTYLKSNVDSFMRMKTQPYFIKDNQGYLGPLLKK